MLKRIKNVGENLDVVQIKVWEQRIEILRRETRTYTERLEEHGLWEDAGAKEGVFKKGWNWGQATVARTKKTEQTDDVDPLDNGQGTG